MFVLPAKMGQNAVGHIRPSLANGPTPAPSLPHSRSPVLHTTCASQSLANGPLPPSTQHPSDGNNHTPGPGTNGDVPYLHSNVLPHNRTGPGDAWKSPGLGTTQVCADQLLLYCNWIVFLKAFIKNQTLRKSRTNCDVLQSVSPILCVLQALQKGPDSHWAGSNGQRVHSSSAWADGGPHNQVRHSTATPSICSEPTVRHPSSSSPSSASLSTASTHTSTSGIPLTKESENAQGSCATPANHSSPKHTSGSPATHSSGNPQLCAPAMGKESLAANARLNHVHLGANSAASSPGSALSATSPSPHTKEPTGSLTKPDSTTVNGSADGACSEDSQSPVKAEPSKACLKAGPRLRTVHSSSTMSICPSSSDILKACR